MRILVLGRNEILYETAKNIIEHSNHEVVAIVTAAHRPEYKRTEQDFKDLAASCNARYHCSERISQETKYIVKESGAEIGISINWVSVINGDFIELLPFGVINAHFADLPRYRGNAAVNWAILRREQELVLTLHFMEPGALDSGDILYQQRIILESHMNIDDVNRIAERSIPLMFEQTLNGLENGTIKPIKQATKGMIPFRCYPRLPRDGKIDWSKPAVEIDALIRSLAAPYPGAYTYFRDASDVLRKVYVWKARVVAETTNDLGQPGHIIKNDPEQGESHVYTGQGILALELMSFDDGGSAFEPGKIWRSIRMRLGMDIEEEIYRLNRMFDRLGKGEEFNV